MQFKFIVCSINPSRQLKEFLKGTFCDEVTKRLYVIGTELDEDQEAKLSAFVAVENLVIIECDKYNLIN